jgi:peptide-methionine (S)-S-oxide reductase
MDIRQTAGFWSSLWPSLIAALRGPLSRAALAAGAVVLLFAWPMAPRAEAPVSVPPPVEDSPKGAGPLQTAVLSGGCFWGVQGVFEHVRGVRRVVAGYAGGNQSTAHYEIVSSGTTGHAESVQITFDPSQVSYGEILRVFFSVVHDPTQLNRQGPDEGTQYRSAIFYATPEQQRVAAAYIAQLAAGHVFHGPIVTRVDPLHGFYPAEGYHQDYLVHNPQQPYIVYNDLPKIAAMHRMLPQMWRDKPVLVDGTAD